MPLVYDAMMSFALCEFAGTAEDAGLFNSKSAVRSASVGLPGNLRTELDNAMFELLVGSESVLPTLQQKAAFLCALQARDRLRLLGLVSSPIIPCPDQWIAHSKFSQLGLTCCQTGLSLFWAPTLLARVQCPAKTNILWL